MNAIAMITATCSIATSKCTPDEATQAIAIQVECINELVTCMDWLAKHNLAEMERLKMCLSAKQKHGHLRIPAEAQ